MPTITKWIVGVGLLTGLALSSAPVTHAQAGGLQIRITQVDNSKFPQVTVYVSVTDAAGKPVSIDPKRIRLSENGEVMQTKSVAGRGDSGPGPITTLLIMDISGSMNKNGKIDGAKAAARAYVDQMRAGDQTGLMVYNTRVSIVQPPTGDVGVLREAIDAIKTGGDTAMYDALIAAEDALKDVAGRKAVIVVTDGLDNSSSHDLEDVIGGIGQGGLSISAIGLGDSASRAQVGLDERALTSLSEQAGGAYSFAGDPDALSALFQLYGRALQNEYAVTYTSPYTLRDGVNRGLSVSLAGSPLSSQSRYNPGGVLPEVSAQSWLLFAAILVTLAALLAAPKLIALGTNGLSRGRKKGRIRLLGVEAAPRPTAARGRIKLK